MAQETNLKWLSRAERRYFVHTKKAVNSKDPFNFGPNDTLYICVAQEGKHLLGWKVTIRENGFWHPSQRDKRVTASWLVTASPQRSAANGAEPTAWFKPNSFYRELTPEQVFNISLRPTKSVQIGKAEPLAAIHVPKSKLAQAQRLLRQHGLLK